MGRDDTSNRDLTASRDARVRAQRIERLELELGHLRFARRAQIDDGRSTASIDAVINSAQDTLSALAEAAGGYILSRKRPKKQSANTCTLFIDECGSHSTGAKDKFDAFSLAAVIVRDSDVEELDARWREWKSAFLGSDAKLVHEPDLRKGNGSLFCGGDREKRGAAIAALDALIPTLPFAAIVCVLRRAEYRAQYGDNSLDASLPQHPYLMTLDFVLERVVMALQEHFDGAKAHVIIESRGPREDAAMQYEFSRLFLDGTSYVSASYFRHQFFPGLEFQTKELNSSGLQIADLLARPCAEKVISPESTPARWAQFREKLCDGRMTEHSILGIKIVPWDPRFEDLWKS